MDSRTFCPPFDLGTIKNHSVIAVIGTTGSGKTILINNIIKALGKPVLVLSQMDNVADSYPGIEIASWVIRDPKDIYEPEYYACHANHTIVLSDDLWNMNEQKELRQNIVQLCMTAKAYKKTIIVESQSDDFITSDIRRQLSSYFIACPYKSNDIKKSIWGKYFGNIPDFNDFSAICKSEYWPSGTLLGYDVQNNTLGWVGQKPILEPENRKNASYMEVSQKLRQFSKLSLELANLFQGMESNNNM